ncbi:MULTISPECIES: Nramp family divalent metal transporter [unclassified Leeuwenhoekiella]|uniref:Nramp family divalent metal transporter n=1 Tax=unclassified Leeuwenhoekiella TaxID=2615029 RepID=UPI000C4FCFEC|nr:MULTISPECIES: Nramp family divalent metal transporter [unclassified Leeuwenhoekiella]MAW96131.1 iron/manganese transporter [Leeuwenhoekiella sp.]MBA80125.1 iron/manganese transporter [Leeuwenhoekiella sp.]|tara:strand:+ start:6786 stop:8651 length:1866 start_codon:yes stop_codon:yes gene_type:complete
MNVDKKSLEEVHGSVNTASGKKGWKRILAFLGPAYLVSVGYMDPGNWATDIAGGSQFGYALLWVLLMSNIMALLLQSLCSRLGIVRGVDLAQASRETYPSFVNFILWLLAEIAIAACDLAEVIGMAIGLNLLFGLPIIWGVCITVLDSFILLFLINKGIRKMEAFIVSLIFIIGLSFFLEMFFAKPDLGEVAAGFIPSMPNDAALYIAIGIIGATVMPHNLYLHSSLVQTRKITHNPRGIKRALRLNFLDSAIALNLAFFVNAAILILAASVFFKNGLYEVADITDAHKLLQGLLGTKWAPILFAVALIAAGQSSTLTGTLAGQIVMEGYLNLRIQPWVRRLATRLIAIIPALFTVIYFGEHGLGELLVLSQVVLSLQLGFAMIPLIHLVSDKKKMKGYHIKWPMRIASWVITLVIVVLNAKLVIDEVTKFMGEVSNPIFIWLGVVPLVIGAGILLIYISIQPLMLKRLEFYKSHTPHVQANLSNLATTDVHKNIAIAVDFSSADRKSLALAVQLGKTDAHYTLIHSVESTGALVYGSSIKDLETESDQAVLETYAIQMRQQGYSVATELVFGSAKKSIPQLINAGDYDLLILGAHGHTLFKDLVFGTTVDRVRHRVKFLF